MTPELQGHSLVLAPILAGVEPGAGTRFLVVGSGEAAAVRYHLGGRSEPFRLLARVVSREAGAVERVPHVATGHTTGGTLEPGVHLVLVPLPLGDGEQVPVVQVAYAAAALEAAALHARGLHAASVVCLVTEVVEAESGAPIRVSFDRDGIRILR